MKLLKKYQTKVYPPLKYTLMIADKCVYYAFLQKHKIPISPFLCLSKNNRKNTSPKNIYNQIVEKKWNGFIGKPILGSSGTGFRMYPNMNNVSEYEIYRQMRNHMNYVFDKTPLSLSANAGAHLREGIPEVAQLNIKYPGDISAYLTVSWLEPRKTREITIVGSEKLLVYDLTEEEVRFFWSSLYAMI